MVTQWLGKHVRTGCNRFSPERPDQADYSTKPDALLLRI